MSDERMTPKDVHDPLADGSGYAGSLAVDDNPAEWNRVSPGHGEASGDDDESGRGDAGQGHNVDPGAMQIERALVDAIETLGEMASLVTRFTYDAQDSLYSKV